MKVTRFSKINRMYRICQSITIQSVGKNMQRAEFLLGKSLNFLLYALCMMKIDTQNVGCEFSQIVGL